MVLWRCDFAGEPPSVGLCAARPTRRGSSTITPLRELEVLEKFAAGGKLNVVLGEKGLVEGVVNLL